MARRELKRSRWFLSLAVLGVLVSPGCALVTDVLNTQALVGFGFDPAVVLPSAGTVIVTVTNGTNFRTAFSFVHATSGTDLLRTGRVAAFVVEPGETANVVLNCPVEVVIPGVLLENGTVEATAAVVQQNDAGVAVAYDGPAIVRPRMFTCGDLISFVVGPAGGAEGVFAITTQIIKGQ